MRTAKTRIVLFVLALTVCTANAADVKVYFSPDGGVAAATAATIDQAKQSVLVMSYSITEPRICKAIVDAHTRGLDVRMIVTRSQESTVQSKAPKLHKLGITIKTDRTHKLMHNKVIICDGLVTCTGSANHSVSADTLNAENLVIITDAEVARIFTEYFEKLWQLSRPFKIIKRRVIKYTNYARAPLLFTNRPQKKEPIKWHLSLAPFTLTMRLANSPGQWSMRSGREGTTFGNS